MVCRWIKFLVAAGLVTCLSATPARSQESEAKGEKVKQPAAASKEEGKAADAAAPEVSAARAAFDKKMEQWKAVLKDMRKLKTEFQTAPEDEQPDFKKRWDELVAQGRAMLPDLRDLALEAYTEAGGADPQLERFLVKFALDAVEFDESDVAYSLAKILLEKGVSDRRLYDAAGVAAFAENQYDDAEKYLKLAKESGSLVSDAGNKALAAVGTEKELWAKEQEIRKAEETANLPQVKLTTTEGEIVLELFENQAPDTVGNFIHLVEKGFYDGVVFHRVLKNFMAQGGDPKGDGSGGPGYSIYDEVDREDYRRHFRGSVSMAKTAAPNSGGSQFFITFIPTPHLDGKHTCFGRVISGMDVATRLQRIDPDMPDPNAELDKIIKAEVIRKRDHAYVPKKVEQ